MHTIRRFSLVATMLVVLFCVLFLNYPEAFANNNPTSNYNGAHTFAKQSDTTPSDALADKTCAVLKSDGKLYTCSSDGTAITDDWRLERHYIYYEWPTRDDVIGSIKTLFVEPDVKTLGNYLNLDYSFVSFSPGQLDRIGHGNLTMRACQFESITFLLDGQGENSCEEIDCFNSYYASNEITTTITNLDKTHVTQLNFRDCIKLEEIILPPTATSIPYAAFAGCKSLKSIDLPETLTAIGDYAFRGCSSLQSIALPGTLESLGAYSFYECDQLQSITLPEAIVEIPNHAFESCPSLKDVEFAGKVLSIGNSAFQSCTSLESIDIPDTVKSIGKCSFSDCTSLAEITLPRTTKAVGSRAFANCSHLQQVTFKSKSIVTIKKDSFVDTPLIGASGSGIIQVPGNLLHAYMERAKGNSNWATYKTVLRAIAPCSNRYPNSKSIISKLYSTEKLIKNRIAFVMSAKDWRYMALAAEAAGKNTKAANWPIISTSPKALSKYTRKQLKRLKIAGVTIVGDAKTVSKQTESQIKNLDIVTKWLCKNKNSTKPSIVDQSLKAARYDAEEVVVVSPNSIQDTLAVSSYVYRANASVVYVDPNTRMLTKAARDYVRSNYHKRIIVVGNSDIIDDKVISKQLKGKKDIIRINGAGSYGSANAFALWSISQGMDISTIGVVTAKRLTDAAIAGIGLSGSLSGPIVFLDNNNAKELQKALSTYKGRIGEINVYGSEAEIPQALVNRLKRAIRL